MSLPKHLHPSTYWEARCVLTEEVVRRFMYLLAEQAVPIHVADNMRALSGQWDRLIGELNQHHPAPPEAPKEAP